MPNRRVVLIAALSVAQPSAFAQTKIEGVTFADTARVAGTELQLNGVGVRAVAWFKGYAAGLYLTEKAATPERVVAAAGPKRLQLRMMQDVPAAEFIKAIDKGIGRNTPADEQPALAERQRAFDRQVQAIGKVRKGDVVDLDFTPGRGLEMSLNGKPRGEPIGGGDFYAAVLRIFIGDRPVDEALKAGLLGKPTA
jgi:hypothetical protein